MFRSMFLRAFCVSCLRSPPVPESVHVPPPPPKPKPVPFSPRPDSAFGHLYLVKEREFLKTDERIFKIGKTRNIRNRMPAYPKNSLLYTALHHEFIDECEKRVIRDFTARYTLRTDIGAEYFEHRPDETMDHVVRAFFAAVTATHPK